MGPKTDQTVQIGEDQNFKSLDFNVYFIFYSLIRKDINLGSSDLDSPQKCASGNI